MKPLHFYLSILISVLLLSCVSTKKFNTMQQQAQARYDSLNAKLQNDLKACRDANADLSAQKSALQKSFDDLNSKLPLIKENNTQLLKQLQDLSVISSSQAESIKKSLENIGAKDVYIQDLQTALARRDSLNLALVMNLKGVIGNLDDQDINIKIEKGVIYIDVSDKLLFNTGSYVVRDKAKEVLGKVALVLKNQPDIEFMVEGHTDSVPYFQGVLLDNWDLSVKRATSVVRILQNQYNIPPERMTAAGRGEYVTVASNETPEGRAANRRTRIVILPQLDQFFKLLERK
ncbi:OmpA family protein [Flavitalea sp. BT771]|uniref:OmpA/MotB family protein n=1 Tax=Flavitalea sp. BT771 TaxID=3063329 RepID=UPI0026E1D602|nr:OmpA family protein [Flavitalea sp. BT771]MDO6428992.1 OmpA family protein [Flavitalea sp. BT771]MDV6218880.1 OmpA family protein [Flavitalea sp. BT771]